MRINVFMPDETGFHTGPPSSTPERQKMIVGMATIISRHQEHLTELQWWNNSIQFSVDSWEESQAIGKAARMLGCSVSLSVEF